MYNTLDMWTMLTLYSQHSTVVSVGWISWSYISDVSIGSKFGGGGDVLLPEV